MLESLGLVPQSSNTKFLCSKEDEEEVMFIDIIRDDDEPHDEGPNEGEGATTGEPVVEYFDTFPTRDELTYHREGDEVAYKMPHKIEQYDSLSDLEKEHTKSVYLRNEEDKGRGVEYVMSKILGFYKECLELRPEYLTGIDDEEEVTVRVNNAILVCVSLVYGFYVCALSSVALERLLTMSVLVDACSLALDPRASTLALEDASDACALANIHALAFLISFQEGFTSLSITS
ncbi:hypothetical protein Tco_0635616 [Tanacetum coccineum]